MTRLEARQIEETALRGWPVPIEKLDHALVLLYRCGWRNELVLQRFAQVLAVIAYVMQVHAWRAA